jgi:hypothetical protein
MRGTGVLRRPSWVGSTTGARGWTCDAALVRRSTPPAPRRQRRALCAAAAVGAGLMLRHHRRGAARTATPLRRSAAADLVPADYSAVVQEAIARDFAAGWLAMRSPSRTSDVMQPGWYIVNHHDVQYEDLSSRARLAEPRVPTSSGITSPPWAPGAVHLIPEGQARLERGEDFDEPVFSLWPDDYAGSPRMCARCARSSGSSRRCRSAHGSSSATRCSGA